jgi:apolipoprotein D and lipocalin family protein
VTARGSEPQQTTSPRVLAGGGGVPKLTVAALALLVAGLGVISAVPRPNRRRPAPAPGKSVDLDRYLGRWYEFARYDTWFERGCEAATAEYSRRPDGLVRIVNTCRRGSPQGPLRWAEAKAWVVPGSDNSKLRVAFFGPFFLGNYWVLDHADDYSWSIVGEGSRRNLWILTRQPVPPAELQSMLIGRAQALGYDTAALHLTQQTPT